MEDKVMDDQLVSCDTAKLAKEKGFNWKTRFRYQGLLSYEIVGGMMYNHNDEEEQKLWNVNLYSAPTQSLLQRWLREVHGIEVIVIPDTQIPKEYSCVIMQQYTINKNIIEKIVSSNILRIDDKIAIWSIYENALEYGLCEALKLIKIKKD